MSDSLVLHFEPCKLSDLEKLISISKETFSAAFEDQNDPDDFKSYMDQAFSKERLRSEMEDHDTEFYFVYWKDSLAAYFKLNKDDSQTDIKRTDTMELERIYVLDAFQGKQLGKHILDWIKNRVTECKKEFVWLGVWEKNTRAIRFYEQNGFQKFGTHPYYIGNDKQTDWLMRFDFKKF